MSNENKDITGRTLEELDSLVKDLKSLDSDPMQVKVVQYYLYQLAKLVLIAVAASATLATFHFGLVDFGYYWKYTPLVMAGGVLYYLIVVVGREHLERSNFDKNKNMIGYWVKEIFKVDEKNTLANERISQLEQELSKNPPEKIAEQQAEIRSLSDALAAKTEELEGALEEKRGLGEQLSELKSEHEQSAQRLRALEENLEKQDSKAAEELSLDALSKAFAKRLSTDQSNEQPSQSLVRSVSGLIETLNLLQTDHPQLFTDAKSLALISEEDKRISQYATILRRYNEEIQVIREREYLDEEDRSEDIIALKRLRDSEIDLLERS